MKWVVSLRDTLKKLYTDYDLIFRPASRFVIAFVFLCLLRSYIGFNESACRPGIILGLSAFSILFPAGFITFICSGFALANMYSVSPALFITGLMYMLLVVFLYFGFRPGKAIYIILVPVGFLLRIPYAVPLILALSGGFASAVPVSVGITGWFMIDYLHRNAGRLTFTKDISTLITDFTAITDELLKNRTMLVLLLAFLICIGVVSFISRLSINHSWTIAVLSGALVLILAVTAGHVYFGTEGNIGSELLKLLVSVLTALAYEFLFFGVDYKATEHLQFEDEEYYYYVKAVPKLTVPDDSERKE